MTFEQAVKNVPDLANNFEKGLKALTKQYKNKLSCSEARKLTGSVNLEEALQHKFPEAPLWDYGIGVKRGDGEKAIWLEFHPASSHHIEGILNKLKWLKRWLAKNAPELKNMTSDYVWVATGSVSFQKHSKQRKKLASKGVTFAGSKYNVG